MATPQVQATRATRRSFTNDFKLELVKWYHENGENAHATARHFKVDRRSVRRWIEKEDEFMKLHGRKKTMRHVSHKRRSLSRELDSAVYDFLMEERTHGRPVSNKALRTKAVELMSTEYEVPSTFKASPMWLKRWKKQYNISMRCSTNNAQKVPEEYEDTLRCFRESVIRAHLAHNLIPSRIINMDQTMCRYDTVPSRTNEVKGKHTVRIASTKAAKKGYTVALAAKGNGEKLPALIIFKERGGQLGPRVQQSLVIPSNVQVTASTNGWMTASLYHWWLRHIYQPAIDDKHHLLLVDNYRPHMTEESKSIVVDECNSEVIFIPPGCTPLVQPMDVSINRPFKSKMQSQWATWFRDHRAVTPRGNLKQPTRQNAIDWVSAAWAGIPAEMIKESFVLCGITADINGADNEKMFSHVPQVVAGDLDDEASDSDTCSGASASDDDVDFEAFD